MAVTTTQLRELASANYADNQSGEISPFRAASESVYGGSGGRSMNSGAGVRGEVRIWI